MGGLLDTPLLIFLIAFITLVMFSQLGSRVIGRRVDHGKEAREDFDIVLAASLTLLGLIIGFAFSMSVNRYEQRKNYEEEEANAIGTEWVRAGLLAAADTAKVRALLRGYLDERILFYHSRDAAQLQQINARTNELQTQLWSAIESAAADRQTPIVALAVSGMNDVLNSQSYTQASWWNRIPPSAWALMGTIAVLCNLMIGVRSSQLKSRQGLLLILPLILSVAFLLIADIDSPRGGYIHVRPQNLLALSATMR
jgi:hypothetical protein